MNQQQKHFNAFLESICSTSGHMDILKPLQEGFRAFCESTSLMESSGYYVYADDPTGRYGHYDEETVRRKVQAGDNEWRDFRYISAREKADNDLTNDARNEHNTRELVADQNAEAAGRDARRSW